MENMFEKGCLVQLSASVWRATRKIKNNQLQALELPEAWLCANKRLIDPEALKPINKVANAARNYLTGISLPFPIQGMLFVPKEMIAEVDLKLAELNSGFNQKVEAFLGDYDLLRETAMAHLGDLFNETDYPVDVRSKFSLAWRFVILDVPNGNTGILAPEVYAREKEKFVETMEEARGLAIRSLREEFSQMVERITERFTDGPDGKPKVFKNGTVNNFYDYFETFKKRNIFNDDGLSELVEQTQAILKERSAADIRSDEHLKENIRTGMQAVESAMDEILQKPRRKISLN